MNPNLLNQPLRDKLDSLLSQTDLEVSELQRDQLVGYVQMLDKWNKAYNLTSVRNPMDMLVKHIMDSIVVSPYLSGERFIDVGTGPGLPGIPLAIMNPDYQFTLLDSLGKRIRFIKQVLHELSIDNVEPVQSRVEEFQSEVGFDGVISRAFASMIDMVDWCHHLPNPENGVFLALKGQLPEDEIAQLPESLMVSQVHALQVPELEGDRHLIILEKRDNGVLVGKIISIANQKGGVGKTTTCVNLAASMAATKRNVLVIDLDPQGNATMASGIDKYDVDFTAYDLLVEQTPFDEVVCRNTPAGYDLIAANGDVTAAEIKLMEVFARELRLKNTLADVWQQYDYIFIDCPPSLNLLTVNAMAASHSVLVPMQCEYFALEGLTALMDTISKLAAVVNHDLKIEGILRTMFDPRNRLSNDVSEQLKKHFGDKMYRTVIPRNVRLAEAPSHGKPAMYYDKYSAGSKAYLALAGEILRREEAQAIMA